MKRNNIRTLFYGGLLSLCCVGMTSCEDYLDKAPVRGEKRSVSICGRSENE